MLKSGTRSGGMAVRLTHSPNSRPSARTVAAGLGGPGEQVDRALVEAEVVHRADDLAVLDQVDAVAGQPGEQQRRRVDLADVPEAGEQQAPLGPGDQVVDGARRAGELEDEVVDRWRRRRARPGRAGPVVAEALEPAAVASSRSGRAGSPLSKTDTSGPTPRVARNGAHSSPGSAGSPQQVEGERSTGVADPGAAAGRREDGAALLGVAGRRPPRRGRPSGRRRRRAAGSTS